MHNNTAEDWTDIRLALVASELQIIKGSEPKPKQGKQGKQALLQQQ